MTDLVFVDTNVLVYAGSREETDKKRKSRAWLAYLWERRLGRISTQVLREYYAVVLRKGGPESVPIARRVVLAFWEWQPVSTTRRVMQAAWQLQDDCSIEWWDALIVAAHECGCKFLLTDDLQHGQRLGELKVISPVRQGPDTLS